LQQDLDGPDGEELLRQLKERLRTHDLRG
jgi:hypothetical protein